MSGYIDDRDPRANALDGQRQLDERDSETFRMKMEL